jgi:hypothetical protein
MVVYRPSREFVKTALLLLALYNIILYVGHLYLQDKAEDLRRLTQTPEDQRIGIYSLCPSYPASPPPKSLHLVHFYFFSIDEPISPQKPRRVTTSFTFQMTSEPRRNFSRKYAEFVALHKRLKRAVRYRVSVPPLPPRLFLGRFSRRFLSKRARHLERFLNAVAQQPELCELEAFHAFCDPLAESGTQINLSD